MSLGAPCVAGVLSPQEPAFVYCANNFASLRAKSVKMNRAVSSAVTDMAGCLWKNSVSFTSAPMPRLMRLPAVLVAQSRLWLRLRILDSHVV
jgi:hypothetical protein